VGTYRSPPASPLAEKVFKRFLALCEMNLPQESLDLILGRNAKTLFSIKSQD
jgi:hypothetical protein